MDHSLEKAKEWLDPFFDSKSRKTVEDWIQKDSPELIESFYTDLTFGTGGMRGIMGVGTNRINKYTIGKATQGLANYLKEMFKDQEIKVAIAYDSRNNSYEFAHVAAKVLAANAIKSFLSTELRPTPFLSFAVRELNCNAGIVITASHNPKEYNGYKVYWNDGGQLVSPHDKAVMNAVNQIATFSEIDFDGPDSFISIIDEKVEKAYIEKIKNILPKNEKVDYKIPIVFTSLHGTGITLIPKVLKEIGFSTIYSVKEQEVPDGNFPTVDSPNPEERSALAMAIELAKEKNADLVMGTDPDTDRIGLAVKNNENEWVLLNGNQSGSILINYLLENLDEAKYASSFVCKTIVTTDLIEKIASHYGVKCINTLTGFKYIAQTIRENEGKLKFIGGGEESFGYLADDFVRDKDAVISAIIFSQIAAKCKEEGISIYKYLLNIYKKFGVFQERLLSVTRKGKAGIEEIQSLMENYRSDTPSEIAGEKVEVFSDYKKGISLDLRSGEQKKLPYESSNVLQFKTSLGSLITVRPSGTEPKIKYYFSVQEKGDEAIDVLLEKAKKHLDRLEQSFV
jgi:phosphoglucomutase